jgi:hypothetical protein
VTVTFIWVLREAQELLAEKAQAVPQSASQLYAVVRAVTAGGGELPAPREALLTRLGLTSRELVVEEVARPLTATVTFRGLHLEQDLGVFHEHRLYV